MTLTKEYLNWLFDYDQERGVLIWKNHWNDRSRTRFVGKLACSVYKNNNTSYATVMINKKRFKVHRLIWLLEKNEQPILIDHIDGNGLNNHISNLRSVSPRGNAQNMTRHRLKKLVGASWDSTRLKWKSQITIKNKCKNLGLFKTEREAHEHYNVALKEFGVS